jgi:hypothetical protein
MADVVAATLDCLRSALAEPSLVMPFLEPLLPYYDAMRDEPRVVDFIARLPRVR